MQQRTKVASKSDSQCICYPKSPHPAINFAVLLEIAFAVKCPLHGDRFDPDDWNRVYTARWLRQRREKWTYDLSITAHGHCLNHNEQFAGQYRKAHFAAFPRDLWVGVQRRGEEEGEVTFLRLNDGTNIQVSGDTDETKRLLTDLLRKRGQVVDLSRPAFGNEKYNRRI